MDKPIQAAFGQVLIDAVADFARADLRTVQELAADEFRHVTDHKMRRSLAERFYGARWLYKTGLALLTKNQERAAHVRAQLLDYGSIAEGLLSHCIERAIRDGHTVGDAHTWTRPDHRTGPIQWTATNITRTIKQRSFAWLIAVASANGIITPATEAGVTMLRKMRNIVHLRESVSRPAVYLDEGEHGYKVVHRIIAQTRAWCASHP